MKNVIILLFLTFCINGYGQTINFPDPNFKNALVNTKCVDTDSDGLGDADADLNDDEEIDVSEALSVSSLEVQFKSITNIKGIETFKNLIKLDCRFNKLTSLDLRDLTNLEKLDCGVNELNIINIKGLNNLKDLSCYSNNLTSLNLQEQINLTSLDCTSNKLTSLNLQGLNNLFRLNCGGNQLTSLNVQGLSNIEILDCSNNRLKTLNVSNLIKLSSLRCDLNQITSLDSKNLKALSELTCSKNLLVNLNLEGLVNLEGLICEDNKISFLNIKGAKLTKRLNFKNNPDLSYICCDEYRVEIIKLMAMSNGQNCEVNSNCSLTNTEDFFTKVKIYPNPPLDLLYLNMDENWTKAEIFDISGMILRSISLEGKSIDVSELECGTYFMRLKDGEKVGRVKFVKL